MDEKLMSIQTICVEIFLVADFAFRALSEMNGVDVMASGVLRGEMHAAFGAFWASD